MTMIRSKEQLIQLEQQQVDEPGVGKLQGRILLAEDNENNQRLLSLYLAKMGLEAIHAENGAVAVRLANDQSPALILMDMQMPVLSGVDAARQIRVHGYTRPIIALTANATKEDRLQCLEAGCDDFLTKPVTRERLYQVLAKYLAGAVSPRSSDEPLRSELTEEGQEFAEIVTQFVTKLPKMIDAIEESFRTNDWGKLREVVHNLKGMGGGFGYPQLSEKATEIEKLVKQENYAAIRPIIEALRRLTQRIQAGIQQSVSVPGQSPGS